MGDRQMIYIRSIEFDYKPHREWVESFRVESIHDDSVKVERSKTYDFYSGKRVEAKNHKGYEDKIKSVSVAFSPEAANLFACIDMPLEAIDCFKKENAALINKNYKLNKFKEEVENLGFIGRIKYLLKGVNNG